MQKILMAMLDQMLELIYVVDIETYELLYINSAGREKYRIGDRKGAKCYKLLQGLDEPCPFCVNDSLTFDSVYSWEFTNKILCRHFLLKNRFVYWNGRKARIQIATDITERESEHNKLKNIQEDELIVKHCIGLPYEMGTLSKAMDDVLKRTGGYFGADRAYFFQASGDKLFMTNEWCVPQLTPEELFRELDISRFAQWRALFETKEYIVIEDMEQMKELDQALHQSLRLRGVRNLVIMPLERDGRLVGVGWVENPSAEKIGSIVPLLVSLRYFQLSAMHRIEYEAFLVKLSFEDSLTGIRNRNCYLQDIVKFRGAKNIGIVYVNINNMKGINDAFGHAYGDKMLTECARRFEKTFSSGFFYRIGGDEFVVICRDVAKEQFEQEIRSFKAQCAASTNFHVAVGYQWAERADDIQHLLHTAEAWMYEDKKQHYCKSLSSDRYRHYNDDLVELGALKKSLKEGRFIVYLQPKVSFADRSVSGAEALVRYQAEDGTVIAPVQFLPVLEDAKIISILDIFILDFICAKLSEWIKAGRQIVPISVNFSRYTLAEQDFLAQLKAVFGKYRIDKKWVIIEITESVKGIEGMDFTSLIDSIRDAGFAISIDDFGVGYANLSLFGSTNFDELKVDKSLVDNIVANKKTQMVLAFIMDICRRMDIRVVAEGVETEEQFGILKRNGCEQAQGYLFSRPIPIQEYEERFLAFR